MGAGELRPHLQSESAGINGRVGQNYRPPTLDFCGKPHGSPIICSNPQGPPLPWQPAVSLIRDKKVGAASSDTGSPGVPPVGERWQQDVGLTLTSSSPLLLLFLLSGLLVALLLATLSRLLLLLTRLLVLLATLALLATLVWIAHVFPRLVSVYAVVNRRPNTLVPFWKELSMPIRSAASSDHMAAGRKASFWKKGLPAEGGGPNYLAYMISTTQRGDTNEVASYGGGTGRFV
jgi:hypothetical protein